LRTKNESNNKFRNAEIHAIMQGCEYTAALDDEGLSGKRIKIIDRSG
jgi:hypothetical protein